MQFEVGDVVICDYGRTKKREPDPAAIGSIWHEYYKDCPYIVTALRGAAIDTTDPVVGLKNGWGKHCFHRATKLDHIIEGIKWKSKT